ncbi:MAG: DUF4350 domain-containing protein [Planctomycetota bacterium]|nr:DUF4350 domain-containing protein [Planctomycetota bacterium]
MSFALLLALAALQASAAPRVHSICDISQEFSFYMDGRFHSQYLKNVGRDARNWGSLHRLDLSNTNLLVLVDGDPHVPYSPESIAHVEQYVRDGGTLLLMADGGEVMPPGAALAERLGVKLTKIAAKKPLRAVEAPWEIEFRGGRVLDLGAEWTVLVQDADQKPVLAQRPLDKGWALVGSRGLFGHQPDAKDPINAAWVTPLLVRLATTKAIDAKRPHEGAFAEHERAVGPLTLEYTDGTQRFADAIASEYALVRPHLVALTGVEPAEGMIRRLLVLPTGGGGFSSGERIAIAAWWGDYPNQRYPMVELISHEAGHSWVLPHPEPLWNEPIATYLGISVGRRLEMPEARRTLDEQIAAGRKIDPDFTRVDPLAEDAARDLVWGKSYFVFEELERLHGPGALAKYFQRKRALVPKDRKNYSMDDCVAVWSQAVGTDLFPWFRSLAFPVDASRTDLD